jgi:hypothetical protein
MRKKFARRLGDRIGRYINWIFYDMRYKKIWLQVRQCISEESHDEHVWSSFKYSGYVKGSHDRSYVCEGV